MSRTALARRHARNHDELSGMSSVFSIEHETARPQRQSSSVPFHVELVHFGSRNPTCAAEAPR
jgi:hypothetical protein